MPEVLRSMLLPSHLFQLPWLLVLLALLPLPVFWLPLILSSFAALRVIALWVQSVRRAQHHLHFNSLLQFALFVPLPLRSAAAIRPAAVLVRP